MQFRYSVYGRYFTRKHEALKYACRIYGGSTYYSNIIVSVYDKLGFLFRFDMPNPRIYSSLRDYVTERILNDK